MICYLGDILKDVVQDAEKSDFVGHIGGDDFIVFTHKSHPDGLCEDIIRRFEAGISQYYDADIRHHLDAGGAIEVADRHGKTVQTSGLSLSLSVICTPQGVPEDTPFSIASEQAAHVKVSAKERPGSTFLSQALQLAGDPASSHR